MIYYTLKIKIKGNWQFHDSFNDLWTCYKIKDVLMNNPAVEGIRIIKNETQEIGMIYEKG